MSDQVPVDAERARMACVDMTMGSTKYIQYTGYQNEYYFLLTMSVPVNFHRRIFIALGAYLC